MMLLAPTSAYLTSPSPMSIDFTDPSTMFSPVIVAAAYALGYFLGDYDGLGTVGNAFIPFWTSTQGSAAGKPVLNGDVDLADRTNVFAASVP